MVHQVRAAKRYRRFVSLVVLNFEEDFAGAGRALRSTMRECDELYEGKHTVYVLMYETETGGALHAVDRYREHLADRNVRCAVASFPGDENSAMGLFSSAVRRIERARELEPGVVVYRE
jgi:hypothetical protein